MILMVNKQKIKYSVYMAEKEETLKLKILSGYRKVVKNLFGKTINMV